MDVKHRKESLSGVEVLKEESIPLHSSLRDVSVVLVMFRLELNLIPDGVQPGLELETDKSDDACP